ncbi:hypothetical protein BN2364_1991 [Alloalcanivorax xenomutans]|uniref:VOC family protein n=1 Tax=Alloalcanivorax xenomutans TaxID=1094342 RepID=UPI0006D5C3D3|nr:VOC family protein [Alloalcanivorax xenomutans]PHS64643.1 MAG: hypothetical protein COB00_11380 [Alcanivorax sp.]CUR46432.1 hypothetical protein BN2364_1991 [Alloalcanivorax xenomutans]
MRLRLRQLCLVADKLEPVVDDLKAVFGLDVCFRDPGVGKFGLHNALLAVGPTFIEIVAPVQENTTAGRYLQKRGGDGGYMVIHDTNDLDGWAAHLSELNIRIAAALEHGDYRGLQLHPGDTGGALLEINTTKGGDQLDDAYGPAGPDWQSHVRQERVRGIAAAELQSADPERLARRWSEVLRRPCEAVPGGFEVPLDHGRLRFVQASDGRGEGLGGLDIQVHDARAVREQARARDLPVSDDTVVIGGMRFYLVSP